VLEVALEARLGSFHLVVDCTLTAEWSVIFGHSGAGKSTLLRLIAGLDGPSNELLTGRITLDGNALTDTANRRRVKPGRRSSGLVAQQPALFPHLTAAENVAYGLRGWDRERRAARVEEMLAMAGAVELKERRPQDLSGGQAQRVALARALAPGPRLLLLDEPFSALDGTASDALLERLQAWVRANGVQVVMATHDVSDALAIGAEVLLLYEGRQAALGPAAEVLEGERMRLLERLGNGRTTADSSAPLTP
jgi:ABC-type sulfate/molybdate transport systems ATPase subunit